MSDPAAVDRRESLRIAIIAAATGWAIFVNAGGDYAGDGDI